LFCSVSAHCQFISGVKHIEIVSKIQDSMVLLNKPDVDKINKTYFEKSKLDSLNVYKDQTINLLENKISVQDSIINNQKLLLDNEIAINTHLRKNLEDNTTQYEKQLKRERSGKIAWQVGVGVTAVGVILALVLK
jgi:hypothetical protein